MKHWHCYLLISFAAACGAELNSPEAEGDQPGAAAPDKQGPIAARNDSAPSGNTAKPPSEAKPRDPERVIEQDPPPPAQPDPPAAMQPAAFRLALVQRYGVPITNATGVACDGSSVWLIGGGHNAPQHVLVHADLATSEIDQMYSYDNLIEGLGTGVYGIANLNGRIYISVAGNTNKLVVVDPTTGDIQKQMQAPTILGPSDLDVANDGQLVVSTGTGDVFTLEATTGAVRSQFAAGGSGRNHGVAVRGTQAFVGSLFGGMEVFDLPEGEHQGHVTKLDGTELEQEKDIGSMCFKGENLLILSALGLSEYEVRAAEER